MKKEKTEEKDGMVEDHQQGEMPRPSETKKKEETKDQTEKHVKITLEEGQTVAEAVKEEGTQKGRSDVVLDVHTNPMEKRQGPGGQELLESVAIGDDGKPIPSTAKGSMSNPKYDEAAKEIEKEAMKRDGQLKTEPTSEPPAKVQTGTDVRLKVLGQFPQPFGKALRPRIGIHFAHDIFERMGSDPRWKQFVALSFEGRFEQPSYAPLSDFNYRYNRGDGSHQRHYSKIIGDVISIIHAVYRAGMVGLTDPSKETVPTGRLNNRASMGTRIEQASGYAELFNERDADPQYPGSTFDEAMRTDQVLQALFYYAYEYGGPTRRKTAETYVVGSDPWTYTACRSAQFERAAVERPMRSILESFARFQVSDVTYYTDQNVHDQTFWWALPYGAISGWRALEISYPGIHEKFIPEYFKKLVDTLNPIVDSPIAGDKFAQGVQYGVNMNVNMRLKSLFRQAVSMSARSHISLIHEVAASSRYRRLQPSLPSTTKEGWLYMYAFLIDAALYVPLHARSNEWYSTIINFVLSSVHATVYPRLTARVTRDQWLEFLDRITDGEWMEGYERPIGIPAKLYSREITGLTLQRLDPGNALDQWFTEFIELILLHPGMGRGPPGDNDALGLNRDTLYANISTLGHRAGEGTTAPAEFVSLERINAFISSWYLLGLSNNEQVVAKAILQLFSSGDAENWNVLVGAQQLHTLTQLSPLVYNFVEADIEGLEIDAAFGLASQVSVTPTVLLGDGVEISANVEYIDYDPLAALATYAKGRFPEEAVLPSMSPDEIYYSGAEKIWGMLTTYNEMLDLMAAVEGADVFAGFPIDQTFARDTFDALYAKSPFGMIGDANFLRNEKDMANVRFSFFNRDTDMTVDGVNFIFNVSVGFSHYNAMLAVARAFVLWPGMFGYATSTMVSEYGLITGDQAFYDVYRPALPNTVEVRSIRATVPSITNRVVTVTSASAPVNAENFDITDGERDYNRRVLDPRRGNVVVYQCYDAGNNPIAPDAVPEVSLDLWIKQEKTVQEGIASTYPKMVLKGIMPIAHEEPKVSAGAKKVELTASKITEGLAIVPMAVIPLRVFATGVPNNVPRMMSQALPMYSRIPYVAGEFTNWENILKPLDLMADPDVEDPLDRYGEDNAMPPILFRHSFIPSGRVFRRPDDVAGYIGPGRLV
jgi:hypothetical protein